MNINHIHPMLVHFPIVLLVICGCISSTLLVTKVNFTERRPLPLVNAIALFTGLACALLAAQFGDIALDAAVEKGFPPAPLEEHEELASLTIAAFSVLSAALLVAFWKRIPVQGGRAIIFVGVLYIAIGLLLATAYRGGELVYHYGVHVEGIVPGK